MKNDWVFGWLMIQVLLGSYDIDINIGNSTD